MNKLFLSIAMIGLALTSCNKDEDPIPNPDGSFPDCIELSGTQSTSLTLTNHVTDPSVPDYCISGTYFIQSDVVVEPGVKIRMMNGSRIRVLANGSFNSVGTANEQIKIEGESSFLAGQWGNIHFSSNNADNQLIHTIINGGGDATTYQAMVFIGHQGYALIDECLVSYSSTNGIATENSDAGLGGISNTDISVCGEYPIRVNSRHVDVLESSITGGANTHDLIDVVTSQLQSPATWNDAGFPYRLSGSFSVNSDLMVMPGTVFYFASGAQIDVSSNGSMNCVGTASQKIRFRGESFNPGFWDGITFISSTSSLNRFEYCEFLNGGGHPNYIGLLTLWISSEVQVGNTEFTNSSSWGVYVQGSSTFNSDGNNTFVNNASGSVGP